MKVDAIQALEPTRRTAMGLVQSNFRETKVEADRWRSTTSAHLRGRARQYRLAAALANCPREEAMFCDMAMMFDQLAYDFGRFENERRRAAARHELINHRTPDSRLNWAEKAEIGLSWIRSLEHFPEKWSPVFRQKMRPLDKTRVLSGSLEPESTLARPAAANDGGCNVVSRRSR
jgi:hypothetical protein